MWNFQFQFQFECQCSLGLARCLLMLHCGHLDLGWLAQVRKDQELAVLQRTQYLLVLSQLKLRNQLQLRHQLALRHQPRQPEGFRRFSCPFQLRHRCFHLHVLHRCLHLHILHRCLHLHNLHRCLHLLLARVLSYLHCHQRQVIQELLHSELR